MCLPGAPSCLKPAHAPGQGTQGPGCPCGGGDEDPEQMIGEGKHRSLDSSAHPRPPKPPTAAPVPGTGIAPWKGRGRVSWGVCGPLPHPYPGRASCGAGRAGCRGQFLPTLGRPPPGYHGGTGHCPPPRHAEDTWRGSSHLPAKHPDSDQEGPTVTPTQSWQLGPHPSPCPLLPRALSADPKENTSLA